MLNKSTADLSIDVDDMRIPAHDWISNKILILDFTSEIGDCATVRAVSIHGQMDCIANDLLPMLQIANKYQTDGLVEICESELIKQLMVSNVVDLLLLTDTYGLKLLKSSAIELLAANYSR